MVMLQAILANWEGSFWLPEQASTVAPNTDWIFNLVLYISVFFFFLVSVLLVVFVVKYRHREGAPPQESTAGHSTALELTWTIIPTLIVLVIYYYGFRGFIHQTIEPPNC